MSRKCSQGCAEKSDFVRRVKETEHLEGRGGRAKHGKRGANLRGNPNDWNVASDDYRLDLGGPLAYAISCALYPANYVVHNHPFLALCSIPLLVLAGLYCGHKYGPHTDIPFKQYLRFQARVQARRAMGLMAFLSSQLKGVGLVCRVLLKALRRCTVRQLGLASLALVLWALAIHLGFGAVYVILVAFAIIFSNLGDRAEGEASAYSIFNNFQYLQGELRMDQVEAEMRGGGHLPRLPGRGDDEVARMAGVQHGGEAQEEAPTRILPLQRNDKVTIENGRGLSKTVKGKTLQEYLDRGWLQVYDCAFVRECLTTVRPTANSSHSRVWRFTCVCHARMNVWELLCVCTRAGVHGARVHGESVPPMIHVRKGSRVRWSATYSTKEYATVEPTASGTPLHSTATTMTTPIERRSGRLV